MRTRNELPSLESVQCSLLTPQIRETHRITELHMLQSSVESLCWGKCSCSSILGGQMRHSVSFLVLLKLVLSPFAVS